MTAILLESDLITFNIMRLEMKMLKKIIFSLIIFLMVSPGFSQKKIFLDVKTPLLEKNKLVAAKAGTFYFLTQSSDLGVREAGEDYSLWLKDYKSRQNGKRDCTNHVYN